MKTALFGRRFAKVKYAFFKNEIVSDSNKMRGKIKTKSFDSSCSFFGINFNLISLAVIHFDFTIIFKNVTRYELNISKKILKSIYIFLQS